MTDTERIVNEVVAELAGKGISLEQVRQIIRTPEETAEERIAEGNKPYEAQLQEAFTEAQQAQTAYWDSLKHLETLIGFDVDGTQELSTLDDLIDANKG